MLTIVMYHYVRDADQTRYPRIKALSVDKFRGQLDYITKHYTVCSLGDVIGALHGGQLLPNACLLTFDDGLADHFLTVLPILTGRGLPGAFFPPAGAIGERRVLDVHKIQFILAKASSHHKLVRDVLEATDWFRSAFEIPSSEGLLRHYWKPTKYDSADVGFIKGVLQGGLPASIRGSIIDLLFDRYVGVEEGVLSRELYLTIDQLRCMAKHGMAIGGHGYSHYWLETLLESEQKREIEQTVDLLREIADGEPGEWVMAYPSGSYNQLTEQALRAAGCVAALTTENNIVKDLPGSFNLGRFDTNDLPFAGSAETVKWKMDQRRLRE